MLGFVARRALASALVVLASTALMYVLVALSGNPLGDLLAYNGPGRADRIAARTAALDLDVPLPVRYARWLQDLGRCVVPGGEPCTLGLDRQGQPVLPQLEAALGSTLRLVLAAAVLALVLGVGAGVVTALRRYSSLDHVVTFGAFACFSLPVFWLSTLLKQYVAIDLNSWLQDPQLTYATIAVIGCAAGLGWAVAVGGDLRRRLAVVGLAGAATAGTLAALLIGGWFAEPSLGLGGILASGLVAAFGWSALLAGLRRRARPVLYAAAAAAVAGTGAVAVSGSLLAEPTWLTFGLIAGGIIALCAGVSTVVVAALAGPAEGASCGLAAVVGALTGAGVALATAGDQLLLAYPALYRATGGRPIPTTGSETLGFDGSFWETALDAAAHLALPTVAIMLISVAVYIRYTRSSMLDVLSHDDVRAARAGGLDERTVVVRYALRTALLPLATLVAVDFAALLGGAVVIETVFGRDGMGRLFTTGLTNVDPNPVMAFFLVTAVATAVFNLLADVAYAWLDPRIGTR